MLPDCLVKSLDPISWLIKHWFPSTRPYQTLISQGVGGYRYVKGGCLISRLAMEIKGQQNKIHGWYYFWDTLEDCFEILDGYYVFSFVWAWNNLGHEGVDESIFLSPEELRLRSLRGADTMDHGNHSFRFRPEVPVFKDRDYFGDWLHHQLVTHRTCKSFGCLKKLTHLSPPESFRWKGTRSIKKR